MTSKLDAFLETIDPSRNLDQLWTRADKGLNSFKAGQSVATDYWEFQRFLVRFFCHMDNYLLRFNPPREPDYEFDAGRCHHLLKKEFGEQADKVVFDRGPYWSGWGPIRRTENGGGANGGGVCGQ